MYRTVRIWLVVGLLMLWPLGLAASLHAQAPCPGLTIRDDADAPLDAQALCAAAEPWINRGFQVYVFATDAQPATEDAWFAIRDEVESAWGIYNPAADSFARSALAVEMMTDPSRPWGHDLAFGEALFNTPLDDDATISRLEGQLKNRVAEGDLTAAASGVLADAYTLAFPATQPAPDAPGQTGAVAAPATGLLGRAFAWLAALGAAIVAAVLFVPRVVLPAWRNRRQLAQRQRHLEDLAPRVQGLIYAARTLFTGNTAEQTTLWKLFLIYGGDKYPDLAQQVREWTTQSMTALDEVLLVSGEMDQREPGKQLADVNDLIRAYEMLYLTLVGTNPQILAMREEEFRAFVDPMLGGVEPPSNDAGLVAQIRELRGQIAGQPLRIELTEVDPQQVDADGIFGYANRIKEVLGRLDRAQQEVPVALSAARQARERATTAAPLPEGLPAERAFAGVDRLLHQADEEARVPRWLVVEEHVVAATTLLGRLHTLLPAIIEGVSTYRERESDSAAIAAEGYQLAFLPDARERCREILGDLYARIENGEIEAAEVALQNLADQSADMHRLARAWIDLHRHNHAELQRLAIEVARVERLRVESAEGAWETLRRYPEGNWRDLAGNLDAATRTLRRLFNDPANANDLASTIERDNSMEVQAFERAESSLKQAFLDLDQAETQLETVIERLADVQEIERNAQAAIAAAEGDLQKATERRDRDNAKIDAEVDRQIEVAADALLQARQRMGQRDFVAAADFLKSSRSISNHAYTSADEQVKAIDDLIQQLKATQTTATVNVNSAARELGELNPSAVQPTTTQTCHQAQATLRQASHTELEAQGKQDRALAEALRRAVELYEQADRGAEQSLQMLRRDREVYEETVRATEATISAARAALGSAQSYTRNGDARGAGLTSLNQAQSLLPALPAYGAPLDAYRRTNEQALRARELAEAAANQAMMQIRAVQEAREAERRRQAEFERRRREAAAAEMRRRTAMAAAATRARQSSSWSSGGSARSSSFGSSSRSRSSSMGSSRRR
jgi:exonuclease VII small subunit